VVRGEGSVFSESRLISVGKRAPVMEVPGFIAVEAENGKPRLVYVVNRSGGALTHTGCGGSTGGSTFGAQAATLQPGKFFHCQTGEEEPLTVQLFGEGPNPPVATLTVSSIPIPIGQGPDAQYTAQILIGT
jgi:hypothetical protein